MIITMKYSSLELGTIEAIVNKLGGMEGAQRFLRGDAEVVIKTHIIDCDANPYIPDGWKVEEHIKDGELHWNPDEVEFYLCDEQNGGTDTIEGNELRKKLKDKPVLNACVLDYLLANPQLIPEEWKGKAVFFWGTTYRSSDDHLYVRYLFWYAGKWHWDNSWLDNDWDDFCPTILSCKQLVLQT